MSVKNGVWHDAKVDPQRPSCEPVLVVREIGKGSYAYRKYDFGIYNASVMAAPSCTWLDGRWNKNGVIYWMPLPEMPEK